MPGGPTSKHAFGNASAEFLKFLRVAQELDQLLHFFLRFLDAGDVLKVILFLSRASMRAFDLPKLSAPLPAMRICWRKRK